MTLFEVVLGNIISLTIQNFIFIWMSSYLILRKPFRLRERIPVIIAATVLFVTFSSYIGAVFYKLNFFHLKMAIGRIVCSYIFILIGTLWQMILYHEQFGVCWMIYIFLDMLENFARNTVYMFQPDKTYDLNILSDRIPYMIHLYFIGPFFMILLAIFLKRIKINRTFRQWIEHMKLHPGLFFLLSIIPALSPLTELSIRFYSNSSHEGNAMVNVLFFLVIFIILNYTGREEMQKKLLEEQKTGLVQQNAYIENLEKLQQDMRRFRHDYKNMMSGMYLSAREGDMETVQNFIQDMTIDFDNQVGSQIQRLTQLQNIRMPEIRGLLLIKFDLMQKENIRCDLEVIYPFANLSMRTTDLCRCIGILIDNAIDEVHQKKDAWIHIMISSQEDITTFRIKNKLYSAVDTRKIWENGYSSRGAGRGIGLASYKEILERYENVFTHTAVSEGCFLQEFKIQNVMK